MTVVPLLTDTVGSDAARGTGASADVAARGNSTSADDAALFGSMTGAFAQAGEALTRAQHSESAFAAGNGSLQEMVFDRARADAILNVASAAASKATQSLNTIVNMQV